MPDDTGERIPSNMAFSQAASSTEASLAVGSNHPGLGHFLAGLDLWSSLPEAPNIPAGDKFFFLPK